MRGFSLKLSIFVTSFIFTSLSSFAGGWTEYFPGDETRCARGEPFSFFVYDGRSDKVVIDFIGGGACWNSENCSEEAPTFADSVDMLRDLQKEGLNGVYNHDHPENPIGDWTHVVVPYCTGDIHWGEQDVTYTDEKGKSFTIHHRGATNAKAVLAWVEENIIEPEKVLVTGCSAGSYGSIYWAPYVRRMFPEAFMTHLGDSGAGVITKDFLYNGMSQWAPQKNASSWIPGLDPSKYDWRELSFNDLYTEVGLFYPDLQLAQFNYTQDENQLFFYELMGGDSSVWPSLMRESLGGLEQKLDNFESFLVEGEDHCILPYDRIYTDISQQGEDFKSWLELRLNGL